MGKENPKLRIKKPKAQLCLGYKKPKTKTKILGIKLIFWFGISIAEKTKYLAKKIEVTSQTEVSIWKINRVSSLTPNIRNKKATIWNTGELSGECNFPDSKREIAWTPYQ